MNRSNTFQYYWYTSDHILMYKKLHWHCSSCSTKKMICSLLTRAPLFGAEILGCVDRPEKGRVIQHNWTPMQWSYADRLSSICLICLGIDGIVPDSSCISSSDLFNLDPVLTLTLLRKMLWLILKWSYKPADGFVNGLPQARDQTVDHHFPGWWFGTWLLWLPIQLGMS